MASDYLLRLGGAEVPVVVGSNAGLIDRHTPIDCAGARVWHRLDTPLTLRGLHTKIADR